MLNMDIGLFEYDRHNALYYFIMNADEQIYMRYGGRDARSPDFYLDPDSFELALQQGLTQHRLYTSGKLDKAPRPTPRFPRDIPLLQEHIIKWGRCVECHLIDDYDLQEMEKAGTIDRVRDMFRYPDIRRIGISLNVPKGLEVENVAGPAMSAGMLPGDVIAEISGVSVFTFADLQQEYNNVDRAANHVAVRVRRGGTDMLLVVELPTEWWWTDLYHRFLSIEPLVDFQNRPLTTEEKESRGLDPMGFASEVIEIAPAAHALAIHDLEVGDILFQVDGVTKAPQTQNIRLYIKLTKHAGDILRVKLLRNGKVLDTEIHSERQAFRKESE